jgi:hypothetical protein
MGRSLSIPIPDHFWPKLGCGIRAQGGESCLIVRDEGVVCIGKHKSNVRTIEQILCKYSRANYAFI